MIIICNECGAEISSFAKACPKCGCPNRTKSKLATSSLVLGIISIVYGLGSCLNDFFTEHTKSTILPAILVLGLLSIIFGFIANHKLQKNKKSLIGIILGIISIFVSIIGRVFF